MMSETIFHVYDGEKCIFASLTPDELKKKIINSEIDLTDHEVEMVRGPVDPDSSY
tara:strand:+ start:6438 stop:6602 length:165 start_codon:yes stop_codon:yes gene_type:complete